MSAESAAEPLPWEGAETLDALIDVWAADPSRFYPDLRACFSRGGLCGPSLPGVPLSVHATSDAVLLELARFVGAPCDVLVRIGRPGVSRGRPMAERYSPWLELQITPGMVRAAGGELAAPGARWPGAPAAGGGGELEALKAENARLREAAPSDPWALTSRLLADQQTRTEKMFELFERRLERELERRAPAAPAGEVDKALYERLGRLEGETAARKELAPMVAATTHGFAPFSSSLEKAIDHAGAVFVTTAKARLEHKEKELAQKDRELELKAKELELAQTMADGDLLKRCEAAGLKVLQQGADDGAPVQAPDEERVQ